MKIKSFIKKIIYKKAKCAYFIKFKLTIKAFIYIMLYEKDRGEKNVKNLSTKY